MREGNKLNAARVSNVKKDGLYGDGLGLYLKSARLEPSLGCFGT